MQVLRAVVSSGSITAAAANLGYTPSAVSQQLSALERQAGVALLEKNGRGVRPTSAGRLLAEYAGRIADILGEAETALAELRAGRMERLRVTFFATAGAAFVPPAVAEFRRRYPEVQLDLRLAEWENPLAGLTAGEVDVAIVVLADGTHAERYGVRLVHLLDDPYRVVLPRGHRLVRQRVVDLAQLAEEPWVDDTVPGLCREMVLKACAAAGFTPSFTVQADDYLTAQGFVAAGLGVTLVPALGLGAPHPGVAVRRLRRPEPVRHIYAAVRESIADLPPVAGLLDALTAAAVG